MRPSYRTIPSLLGFVVLLFVGGTLFAQSSNQNFPTPVTSNEISGTIKPRDIGDARLTSYFYQFDADQGDLFINVVTRNFTGDIDVFSQTGLKPLTKIVVYADFAESETGRVLYFRKPEKLILRIQGRTPGDEAASFRIKFAGSFIASTQSEPAAEPSLPNVTAKNDSGIRVNSVGTIVEVIPKATPTPIVETAKAAEDDLEKGKDAAAETREPEKTEPSTEDSKKVGVVVTENMPASKTPANTSRRSRRQTPPPKKTATTPETPPEKTSDVATVFGRKKPPARTTRAITPAKTPPVKAPDPLANINLVIELKDGSVVQRPMSEVLRFTVDRGILTVIAKDGSIVRYSILDVAKLTVQ